MPRYFIDTIDGAVAIRDHEGEHFESMEAARQAVIATLPDLVDEVGPAGRSRTFVATLRDENGETIYVAKLDFEARWQAVTAAAE